MSDIAGRPALPKPLRRQPGRLCRDFRPSATASGPQTWQCPPCPWWAFSCPSMPALATRAAAGGA